jgi:uncharacterized protein GlcG (DUF336 family)
LHHKNNDTKVEHFAFSCRCKFSSINDAWLVSLDISVKKAKTGRYFETNTITIGELSHASRPLFNIVYCDNSLITFLDGITIKH